MHRFAVVGKFVLAAVLLSLGACSSLRASGSDEHMGCPHVEEYNDAELAAIQKALSALPDKNPLVFAMQDYEELRYEARLCRESAIKKN